MTSHLAYPSRQKEVGSQDRAYHKGSKHSCARLVSLGKHRHRHDRCRRLSRIGVAATLTTGVVGNQRLDGFVLLRDQIRREGGKGAHLLTGGAVAHVAVVLSDIPTVAACAVRQAAVDNTLDVGLEGLDYRLSNEIRRHEGGRGQGAKEVALEGMLVDVAEEPVRELAGAFNQDALGEKELEGSVDESTKGLPPLFSIFGLWC